MSLTVDPSTYEDDAPAVATPILSNTYYADWQMENLMPTWVPELDLEPFLFAGGSFTFHVWSTNPMGPNNALVYCPFNLCIFIADEYDAVGQGDPFDVVPSGIPQLFRLDYGYPERAHAAVLPPPRHTESPWFRQRVLWRHWGLLDKGTVNLVGAANDVEAFGGIDMQFAGPAWNKRVTCRVKGAPLKRNQGLYAAFSAFYTQSGASPAEFGCLVAGHFGYRRYHTGAS